MLEILLSVLACAPAPPEGKFVAISAEQAVIVWDEAARKEHFIRRAAFETDAADFGFLVPTPSRPELTEVPASLFDELDRATKPKRVPKYRLDPTLSLFFLAAPRSKSGPLRQGVTVLEIARVAGYEAAVLQADDADAMAAWLREHGYAATPSLSGWLKPYIEQKWTVTAFKVVERATAAVRMSFDTDKPFFPYREPIDQRSGQHAGMPRSLRVMFVGPWKAASSVGTSGATPAVTYWAQPFSGTLPVPVPAGAWLTVFHDESSPRPGTDELFFSKAADGAAVMPEEEDVRDVPLPLDCLCVVGVIAGFGVRVFRKRKDARSSRGAWPCLSASRSGEAHGSAPRA